MTDLNSVCLGGRLTRDCVLEKTQNGMSIVRVSMAINRSMKKKDTEEWVDKPAFVDFTLFGNYAESMFKWLKKGTYINVEGHLDTDSWTDKDGKNHQQLKFVAEPGKLNPWVGGAKKEAAAENTAPAAPNGYDNVMDFPPDESGAIC
ncbi:single-stranded DNA-binding protein [Treponema sp. UBA753]|uniref:single-stranded DNA-binding protein n=1 Tax=Treponema sp. UBA753 TaxID=1947747 RepID=UPI0025F6C526|nr:single-stranded DNA-binding protein [Treponema sp. UBA753]